MEALCSRLLLGVLVLFCFTCVPVSLVNARNVFTDISFNTSLEINNRTIKCLGKSSGKQYLSQMYTCENISVNDAPLFHGYNEFGKVKDDRCTICPCGEYHSVPNDIIALCHAMLQEQQVKYTKLLAAYVPNPICKNEHTTPEFRVKYIIDDGEPKWLDTHLPNGYIYTLQCLTQ